MNTLIIEIIFSGLIVLITLYLSNYFVKNEKSKTFIIKHNFIHPNQISIFRVFLWIFALWLFHFWFETFWILLFVFASILDATDWIIARWCNLTSELWKSLDPLADKIVYIIPLFYFSIIWKISLFLVIIFVIIDILWQFSRILLDKLKLEKKANIYWKVKTIFVFTIILYLMIIENKWLFNIDLFYNNLLLIIAIIFAILSIVFKFVKKT